MRDSRATKSGNDGVAQISQLFIASITGFPNNSPDQPGTKTFHLELTEG